MWEIKGKDNQTKAVIHALEYNGVWMDERYVTLGVESPIPISFAVGDYLTYRGERFEINYDPGKIKSAPPYKKGDAFKYENIKFNSLADELTRCEFLDVVPSGNQLHFTGLPKFPFYGNVQDLAGRIQANLDRAFPGLWTVIVSPEYTDTKELNVSVDNIKVQGALSILVNDFKTYFTTSGRTITIGAAGIPAGHLFKYGKGNGLHELEQNAEADQTIVTRLRAYGSTRNLPHRYYNSLSGADGEKLIPDNMAVQHLMLPEFPYSTLDPYIDSANKAALGIREEAIFFDGSQEGLDEIYPSIEGMTAEELKAAGVNCNSTGALDEIVGSEQMSDNGVGEIDGNNTTANPATFKVTLKDLGFDINDHLTTETATLSFKTGMLGGRDFEIVENGCKPIKNASGETTGYEVELKRVYDNDINLWFPYVGYNAQPGDKFVLLHIEMPEVYIKAAAQRMKEAAEAWLAKNDYSRSVYAPKVDEIFMARQHDAAMASGGTITSLHDTITEGMLLLFEDDDLNIDASIFIDRLTIKEGDGAIPTYELVLKEEKTVGRLDKMQNLIDSLVAGKGQGGVGGYTAAQIRSMIEAYGGAQFLSKLKDDRTPHKLSSDKAFEVGEYLAGASGGIFGMNADGESFAEVGRLYVRVKAFFEELTTVKSEVLAGRQYITPGGGIRCVKVAVSAYEAKNLPLSLESGGSLLLESGGSLVAEKADNVFNGVPDGVYRCYFLAEQDGEKTECKFIANDLAVSEMFNAKTGTSNKVSNHRYWRKVVAVNNDAYEENGNRYGYIDLSMTECENGSDAPQAGDYICQLGYDPADETDKAAHKERMTAMVFDTVGPDAPSLKFYSGIDAFSLDGKAIITMGRNPVDGKIFFRLGASGATQYLDYTQDGGLLVAGRISSVSTVDGKPIGEYVSGVVEETGAVITDKKVEYAVSLLGNTPPPSGWQTDIPTVAAGNYLWTRTTLTYSDNTSTQTYSVSRMGKNGADGKTSYVHFAYASGITGTLPHPTAVTGFSTVSFPGARYIGVCTDFNEADPDGDSAFALYEWSLWGVSEGGGVNLLRNTDYLDGLEHWAKNADVTVSDTYMLEGRPSAHMRYDGGTNDWRLYMNQEVAVSEDWKGKPFTLSAYFRSDSGMVAANAPVSMEMRFLDSSGNRISTPTAAVPATQDGLWHRLSASGTCPANAAKIAAVVVAQNNAELLVNGMKLEMGNTATQWSASPMDASYLRSAFRESTTIDRGLVVATLLKLGYTAEDGEYKVMAGVNGAANVTGPRDIAFWAGGEAVDAANAGGKTPATYVVRHDGTVYACGNTVRFEANRMEIGDNLELNERGLFLKGSDGAVRLRITNEEVWDGVTGTVSIKSFSHDLGGQITIGQAGTGSTGGISTRPQHYVKTAVSFPAFTFSGTLSAGSTVTGTVSLSFSLPSSSDLVNFPLSATATAEIQRQDGAAWRTVYTQESAFFTSGQNCTCTISLNASLAVNGTYRLLVRVPSTRGGTGDPVQTANISGSASGKVTLGVDEQTVVGNNGIMTIWNGMKFVASRKNGKGYFGVLVGNYGLQITADGFKKTINGGASWLPVDLPTI